MGSIRDYDGNNLGGISSWKLLGDVDIQGDGDLESILVNPAIGRFASVGTANGNVDFSRYGLNGDTRVVGIYSGLQVGAGQLFFKAFLEIRFNI
ncbi:hypothetical protein [Chamaesiphon sp.]|uniref:hypothetical protein n=1 Tax=Chamaesiphon sp. TaxID=2814140 RepID=UPI003593D9A8